MKKFDCFILAALLFTGKVIAEPTLLTVKEKTIWVNGKSIQAATIEGPNGSWGYSGKVYESFDVIVKNELAESTVIHWHGLILPNSQDGVAGLTEDGPIAPGTSRHYSFPLIQSGTYWVHSHHGLQLQRGVEAPFIIETEQDKKYQQVVVMFQDFSFKNPESILSGLTNGAVHGNHDTMKMDVRVEDPANMEDMSDMPDMDHDMDDLNDVKYDAYLTNYHAPSNPQITVVKPDKEIKLRFINGAAASNFWVNLGKLKGRLVAVDGQEVYPITDSKFQIAMGQRLDIIVKIPKKGGAFPILGQVEGMQSLTGLILTTKPILKTISLESWTNVKTPPLDYSQELRLHSTVKIDNSSLDKINLNLVMTGSMNPYSWQLNHQSWPNVTPLKASLGQLVTLSLDNQSMMAHPVHLHGYDFKIISIDGKSINGALRDTVLVLPNSKVVVQFKAAYPGKWALHCHTAYHMEAGMMTYLVVK